MGFPELHDVPYYVIGKVAEALDPGEPPNSFNDQILLHIHADLENLGRVEPTCMVSVHHRNIVLHAVAKALREHCR